jgi:hypothetical protein
MVWLPTRRDWIIGSLGFVAVGCRKLRQLVSDEPDVDAPLLTEDELVRRPVTPASGTFTGTLEARSFMSHGDCSDPGTLLHWLVLAIDGKRLPMRLVDDAALEQLRVGNENALERDSKQGELLTPEDASKLGLEIGGKAKLFGVHAALHFSGTIALMPIYGLCTNRIERV